MLNFLNRTATLVCSILVTLIILGATQKRLEYNVTMTELGSSPLLRLSFPLKGYYFTTFLGID